LDLDFLRRVRAAAAHTRARHHCWWLLLPIIVQATAAGGAEAYQLPAVERYLAIVERQPFGLPPPPPPPPPAEIPQPPAEKLAAKNFVLFEIVHTPAGEVMVGFADNGAKPPRNLLLALGEELDGYTVTAADFELETATILKDGLAVELRMNNSSRMPEASSAVGAGAKPAAAVPAPMGDVGHRLGRHSSAPLAARRAPGVAAAEPPVPNSVGGIDRLLNSGLKDNSYVGRLRERRDQLVKQTEEERLRREEDVQTKAQVATTSEMSKRLRETNLNLIRKGLKPIGTIELTPEEDAQLVEEGVFPAK
jgi:hypothetical protein